MTDQPRDPPPRNWSSLFLFVLLAAIIMVGGMVLLGIPGALVAGVTAPVVELLRGYKPGLFTQGDRAWGAALLMTMTFPPGIPISYWISTLIWPKLNHWLRAVAIIVGTYIWSVLAFLAATFFM